MKVSGDILKFISESQKISGFSGHISEETATYEPDMAKIAKDAEKFGAQIPVQIGGHSLKDLSRLIGERIPKITTHLLTHQVMQLLGVNMVQLDKLVREGRVIRQDWSGDQTIYPIDQFK